MMAAQFRDHPGLCCRDRHLLSAWLPLSTWANTNTSKGELQIRSMENTNTDHWQIQMRLLDKYKLQQWKNTNTGKKYN